MLGFLEKVRLRRSVVKRLRLARLDTLPRSYINTVRFQLGRGAIHGALLTAQEGLDRFPNSDELSGLHRFAVRRLALPARRALQAECDKNGDDASMSRLIRLHIECSEFDEALALASAMEGAAVNRQSLRLRGEVFIQRFLQDRAPDDARRGIDYLERSIEGADDEFEVVWLLAQVHEKVGVVSRSLYFVYRALGIDAAHSGALALHGRLIQCPLESVGLDEVLKSMECESTGKGSEALTGVADSRVLQAQLSRFSSIRGVRRVFFMSGSTLLSAGEEVPGDSHAFCNLAREFSLSTARSSRRMGMGSFQRAVLHLGRCCLFLFVIDDGVLVVESDAGQKTDLICSECDDLVASWSQQSEEAVYA